MSTRWRTCLVVIARNEAAHIGRLLDSVRPWLDDMLVLDTGSTDDTAVRAAQAGARVAHAPWPDDFAQARNTALDLANADWHLVLDADEWLISGGEALEALRQTAPDFVGTVALEDHFDDGVAHTRLSRLLPGDVRYAGRIHEQPVHQRPVYAVPLHIGHDGYLSARLRDKAGRNRRLLEAAIADQPASAYLWYQLGKDCSVYNNYAEAEDAFANCAGLLPSDAWPMCNAEDGAAGAHPAPATAPAWWPDLVARRLFGLKRLGRHADGVVFADGQLAICESSPDVFFALGDLLLDWAAEDPGQADVLLPMMEDAWRRCLLLGEQPDQPGAVAGRGSYLAAHNLALVLEGTGRAEEAQALREQFPAPRS
ncbi:glycosyltransferase family 2 protein [Roseateles terrae]|uniref:Tetratricopeptide (TPR) repeat protein n=1 Tax=Roseateles terrae TaxID=431060 RepID=A0ABR6GWP1_9BURK|nr:glycosyltransferase family 2 protein [Roseateles terrae]MBB3196534.1 tetratricopeptide (TPR) repeat protein [Roseateles terrae]OWQ82891.1 hypothetical protein CDN98_23820 [Roseateles terrae]